MLRPTRLNVVRVPDPCTDSATKIGAEGGSEPVLLVKGLAALQAGNVKTVFAGRRFIYPAESESFQLGERNWYWLGAYGTAEPGAAETFVTNYRLVVGRGGQSQTIAEFERLDWDGPPQLLWLGDLDRDGVIDVFADLRTHYASHNYVLFLSSVAEADSLLGRAAEFSVPGC